MSSESNAERMSCSYLARSESILLRVPRYVRAMRRA